MSVSAPVYLQGKELPTYKDVDFRNNLQKVYVSSEEKEKVLDKLHRDVEVKLLLETPHASTDCRWSLHHHSVGRCTQAFTFPTPA